MASECDRTFNPLKITFYMLRALKLLQKFLSSNLLSYPGILLYPSRPPEAVAFQPFTYITRPKILKGNLDVINSCFDLEQNSFFSHLLCASPSFRFLSLYDVTMTPLFKAVRGSNKHKHFQGSRVPTSSQHFQINEV